MKKTISIFVSVLIVLSVLMSITAVADGGDYTGGEEKWDALGHSLVFKSEVPATCTEQGYSIYYCETCKKEYRFDYKDIIPHTESNWIVDVQPTETTEGHRYKECTVCKAVLAEESIAVATHIAGDINKDGSVNNKDLMRLLQYITGNDVDLDLVAADVNGDKSVDNKDLVRLFKYLSDIKVEIFYDANNGGEQGNQNNGGAIYLPEAP